MRKIPEHGSWPEADKEECEQDGGDIGGDLGFLHVVTSQFDAVVRIEGRLTRDVAEAGLHGAGH